MKPREVASIDGVALGHYEETDLVSLKIEGHDSEVIIGLDNWRGMVKAWNEYDKGNREAAIDRRVFKDRPDGW